MFLCHLCYDLWVLRVGFSIALHVSQAAAYISLIKALGAQCDAAGEAFWLRRFGLSLSFGFVSTPLRKEAAEIPRRELSETAFYDLCVALLPPSWVAQEYLWHAEIPAGGGSNAPVAGRAVGANGFE
jgi:hypothetical protein